MNQSKFYLILIAIFAIKGNILAQNTVEKKEAQDQVLEIGPQNIFLAKNVDYNPKENIVQLNTNNIFITQVGADNLINATTRTKKSDIELQQNGSDNVIRINITALNTIENIKQNGSNNYFAEFANTPNLNLERKIEQNGNSQNLVIHGNNSISDKIQLNMQGNSKTVVIRNFN